MSLAELDETRVGLDMQKGKIQIIYNIETVNNLNVGASIQGAGIGSISNEMTFIEQNDPEVAVALKKLYEMNDIKNDIRDLTTIIAEYYKNSSKEKNKGRMRNKLDSIKTCVEVATGLVPFYNIIATKFGFPIIPI